MPFLKKNQRWYLKVCLGLFVLSCFSTISFAQFQINFPVSRIVFQRNNSNQANVPFRFIPTVALTHINVRMVVRQGGSTTNWASFAPSNGIVSGQILSVQGGWYDLEAEAFNGSTSLGTKRITRVGVGEVLIFAGQSNAQGFAYTTGATDDRVSCIDFYSNDIRESRFPLKFSHLSSSARVGPTNNLYLYGLLGDKLVQRLGVPVLIYGAGWGGTPSLQWRQSAEGNLLVPDNTQWAGADELMPYRAIKVAVNHYVQRTGLRGIFWHQGESDKGLSASSYVSNLKKIIQVSRQDVGWSTLPWIICRASWIGGSGDANIVAAQNQVISEEPYCYTGTNTDNYGNSYRSDQTHFLASFYPQLAQLWSESLSDNFFQQSSPYVLPTNPPRITVGLPQPAYQYAGGHMYIPFLDEAASLFPSGSIQYTAELVTSDEQFVASLGTSSQNPLLVTLPTNVSGNYKIRISSSFFGAVSSNSPSVTIFQNTYSQKTGTGLSGQYISGIETNHPILHTRTDGPLDLTWFRSDEMGPAPLMPIRDYIVRWTGEVEAPVTGTYTIRTSNDDGVRLWINNQLIIDDWVAHPWSNYQRGQISMQANQRYSVRYELLQRWNDAQARLQWVVPGTTQAVYIPKDRLFPATISPSNGTTPIQITYPLKHMVFQRSTTNTAQVTIAGTCPTNSERIEIRVSPTVSSYGQNSDIFVVLDNAPSNGLFSGTLPITGGWYNLDVQAISQNQVIAHTRLTPVGVGEVFVIAGEGNAQGITPTRSVAAATDSRVVSIPVYNDSDTTRLPIPPTYQPIIDGEMTIGPHSNTAWGWSELGDQLTRRLNVPVLFYNVAWAGTILKNWRESMEQGQTTTIAGVQLPKRMPYGNLKRVLQDYLPITGLRAIIWQQGESEYYSNNPTATTYATDLQAIIAETRQDARFAQLPWIVARSSADNTTQLLYPSGSYEPVTNQQNSVIQSVAQVVAGPIIDTIQMPRPDGKHLWGTGLTRLALGWNNVLTDAVWSLSPATPKSPVVSDLTLSMQSTVAQLAVTSTTQISLVVSNNSASSIEKLQVRSTLHPSLQFVSSPYMTMQQGCLIGDIDNIPAGQSATLTFTIRATQEGPLELNAAIIRVNSHPMPFIRCNTTQ